MCFALYDLLCLERMNLFDYRRTIHLPVHVEYSDPVGVIAPTTARPLIVALMLISPLKRAEGRSSSRLIRMSATLERRTGVRPITPHPCHTTDRSTGPAFPLREGTR